MGETPSARRVERPGTWALAGGRPGVGSRPSAIVAPGRGGVNEGEVFETLAQEEAMKSDSGLKRRWLDDQSRFDAGEGEFDKADEEAEELEV